MVDSRSVDDRAVDTLRALSVGTPILELPLRVVGTGGALANKGFFA